jgi:hypothetical protein
MLETMIAEIKNKATSSFPVASEEEIENAENELGFTIPPLLKIIYQKVGNGGFGPGYGILGLKGGKLTDEDKTIVEHYKLMCMPDNNDSFWSWPHGLLPFCDWGCAIYSCVSCLNHPYSVLWFDPNKHEIGQSWNSAFTLHRISLEDWFLSWLSGENLFDDLHINKNTND